MSLLQAPAFITLTTLHEFLHIKTSLDTLLKSEHLWRLLNKKLEILGLKLYTNGEKQTAKKQNKTTHIHSAPSSLCFLEKKKKREKSI